MTASFSPHLPLVRDIHVEFQAAHAEARAEMMRSGLVTASPARAATGVVTRPTGRVVGLGGGSTGRLATLPGADPATEEDAARTNAVISSGKPEIAREWASLYGDPAAQDAWWAAHEDELGLLDASVSVSSCPPLLRPASVGKCGDRLEGSDKDCSKLACTLTRSLPDMAEYQSSRLPVTVYDLRTDKSACDNDLERILAAAWRLLSENTDLMRWAACWAQGPGADGDCLVRLAGASWYENAAVGWLEEIIAHGVPHIGELVLDLYIVPRDFPDAGAVRGVGLVIYSDNEYWQSAMTRWGTASNTLRACIALDVAATLLHEFTHLCLAPIKEDSDGSNCGGAYVAESVFRWALFQRYPDIANASCCAQHLEDGIFADGGAQQDFARVCDPIECDTESTRQVVNSTASREFVDHHWKYDSSANRHGVRR